MNLPILYSFRRCPYAMRARMALLASGMEVELREVVLRDKPAEMLQASPKATVPVLIKTDGSVLEESFEIMQWSLQHHDQLGWLNPSHGSADDMLSLIQIMDGSFKDHLDKYKYAVRHVEDDVEAYAHEHRDAAVVILQTLETRLSTHRFLFGDRQSLADVAIAPFVRQFANTNIDWFQTLPLPNVQSWLTEFVDSSLFQACMNKYEKWESGSPGLKFPEAFRGSQLSNEVT